MKNTQLEKSEKLISEVSKEHKIPLEHLYNECVAFQSKYGFLDEMAIEEICKKLVEK